MEVHLLQEVFGNIVCQGDVLHAHKASVGHSHLRVVIGIVGAFDIFFAYSCNEFLRRKYGNIGLILVAWIEPAVVVRLGKYIQITEFRVESRVESYLVASLNGEEERQFPILVFQRIGQTTDDTRFNRTMINEIGLGILCVEEVGTGNV